MSVSSIRHDENEHENDLNILTRLIVIFNFLIHIIWLSYISKKFLVVFESIIYQYR